MEVQARHGLLPVSLAPDARPASGIQTSVARTRKSAIFSISYKRLTHVEDDFLDDLL
jgi:hypothetical protein